MDLLNIVSIAAILCVAGLIQSAVGFAYALFATPLLLWIGVPLPNAIATVAVCSFTQSVLGTRHLRIDVPWRLSLTAIALRSAVVGCILCALVAIQCCSRFRPKESVHFMWGGLAFISSGLLAGVSGMGGPPLVLWALAHDWSVKKTRGFLFSAFAGSLPIQVALLWTTFGSDILRSLLTAVMLVPAVFLGTFIGLSLGNRIHKNLLRKIVYSILLIIGLSSIGSPIVQHLG